jgi:uncharacterized membrane protein YoaK (UPF0700 family)
MICGGARQCGVPTSRQPPLFGSYLRDAAHGPLPGLLVLLTVATGVVDAVSILALGRVFVANMTGNIVFIGFALARAPGFSLAASVIALAGFLAGAWIGGQTVAHYGTNRAVLLRNAVGTETVLLLGATLVEGLSGSPSSTVVRDAAVALAALALGLQNAAVRKLAVPDLTTTVLTMTLTGIAAELRTGNVAVAIRRVLSVLAMLVGAFVGALLVLHANAGAALSVATGLAAVVFVSSAAASRRPAEWQKGKP